ncbi:armadillo-type protein [Mycena capillaripes]|nr:armadillo-type protein [Mycena capillaripes]
MYTLSQIARWRDGPQAIVTAKMLDHVLELLESQSSNVREETCLLIGRLIGHESTAPAVLDLKPCLWLVTLLRDKHHDVVAAAALALSQIASSLDGVQTIIDAKTLDYVLELLDSRRSNVRRSICMLVGNIAGHQFTALAVLNSMLCLRLLTLLSDNHPEVIAAATFALSQLAYWPDGAQAIVDAKTLGRISELLHSRKSNTRKWSCKLMGRLASHESTAPAVAGQISMYLISCRNSGSQRMRRRKLE